MSIQMSRNCACHDMDFLLIEITHNSMFENLFRIAMEKFNSTLHCRKAQEAAPHVIKKAAAVSSNDDPELEILGKTFGALTNGKVIEVNLQELLALVPRTRKRSDAYRGLCAKLRRMGVTLNITTNRTKKEEKL